MFHFPIHSRSKLSVPVVVTTAVPVAGTTLQAPSAAVSSEQEQIGLTAKAVANVTVTGLVPPVTSSALSVPPAVTVPVPTVGRLAMPRWLVMWPLFASISEVLSADDADT